MKTKGKNWRAFLMSILFVSLSIVAGYKVWQIYSEYQSGEDSYSDADQYISLPDSMLPQADDKDDEDWDSEIMESEPETEIVFPVVDFDSLRQINSQVVGWIYGLP